MLDSEGTLACDFFSREELCGYIDLSRGDPHWIRDAEFGLYPHLSLSLSLYIYIYIYIYMYMKSQNMKYGNTTSLRKALIFIHTKK